MQLLPWYLVRGWGLAGFLGVLSAVGCVTGSTALPPPGGTAWIAQRQGVATGSLVVSSQHHGDYRATQTHESAEETLFQVSDLVEPEAGLAKGDVVTMEALARPIGLAKAHAVNP